MEISKLLEEDNNELFSDLTSSHEKQKLNIINNNNVTVMERFKKSIELLDKIELSLNQKVKKQLCEIEELKNNMSENTVLFKSICKNIIG